MTKEGEEVNKNAPIVIYRNWLATFTALPDEQVGQMIKVLSVHIMTGKDCPIPDELRILTNQLIADVDGELSKYAKKCEKNKQIAEEREAKKAQDKNERDTNVTRTLNERDTNVPRTSGNSNSNSNSNSNNSSSEELKKKATKSRVFVPPTLEEVEAEIQAKGHHVDALEFFNYYDSQAWKKANGQRVSNWRGCLVTWDRKNRQNEKEQTQAQDNVTDWDKIAKEVGQLGYFDNVNNHANVFAGIPATVREDVGG